jgi:hypothetical protein
MSGGGPLAELNAYIRGTVEARRAALEPGDPAHPDDLFNARVFRKAWERGRTLDRFEQAIARTPANAGPLNSHALVLRSLGLMRELSTDYLRRFLVQAETLQWLEKAREKYPREDAKAGKVARRGKRKK